jgi:hypothetical protein
MMVLLWLTQAALATAACEPMVKSEWSGDTYNAILDAEAGEGAVPCRTVDLGSVLEWTPEQIKVVVRQWDDTRVRFGMERIYRENGRWVLHVPELRTRDRLHIELEGVRARQEEEVAVDSVDPEILNQVMEVEWVVDTQPVFGPGGSVSRVVHLERAEKATDGLHRFWWPEEALDGQCEAAVDGDRVVAKRSQFGCSVAVGQGRRLVWTLSWTESGVSSADEWLLNAGDVLRVRGGEFVSAGLSSEQTERGLEFHGPGRLSVRLHAVGELVIENKAVAEVQYAALAVSIPEPGLGIEFKGYRGDSLALPVLLQKVRSQMVTGMLPDQHPLKPRKLTTARRSRWGTPWEQALVLTRYLQQLKIQAEVYPVRPALMGPILAGVPLGYVGAVVRAQIDQTAVWLDPSCGVCGVDEVSPAMWGGQVFGSDLKQLPPAPKGKLEIQPNGDKLHVFLAGPPALDLRRWLAQFEVSARPAKVAEKFGGEGSRLLSHEGLTELGKPITLEISVQSRK